MYQCFVLFQKFEKMVKKVFLSCPGIRKPLDQVPDIVFVIGAADQVQLAAVTGKAGGFDIKKEKILQFSDPL